MKLKPRPQVVYSDQQPREKLIEKGPEFLTDEELLAIILGTGNHENSALNLAKNMLAECEYALDYLARMSYEELREFKGIGPAKAVSILSVFELSRRKATNHQKWFKIQSSKDAYDCLKFLEDSYKEEFWVIYLNRGNRVIKKERISSGGINATVVDVRIILSKALKLHASGLICAHNHPSGNPNPSQSDEQLTRKIKEASKLLDIQLLDHLIIAGKTYTSFADEGMI